MMLFKILTNKIVLTLSLASELWVVSHGELCPPRPPALLSCDPTLEPVTRDTSSSGSPLNVVTSNKVSATGVM